MKEIDKVEINTLVSMLLAVLFMIISMAVLGLDLSPILFKTGFTIAAIFCGVAFYYCEMLLLRILMLIVIIGLMIGIVLGWPLPI